MNCFGRNALTECQSKVNCSICGKRHHSTIHDVCANSTGVTSTSATSLHVRQTRRAAVLFATVRVDVADKFGTRHPVQALVNSGSEVSIISEGLVQRLKLPRSAASIDVFGVGGQRTGAAQERVALQMLARTGDFSTELSALILPKITSGGSRINVASINWPHVQELRLADPEFSVAADLIELLFGEDIFTAIVEDGLRKGSPGSPVAQRTTLG